MLKKILSLMPRLLMGALLAAVVGSGALDRDEPHDAWRTSLELRQHVDAAPLHRPAVGMASGPAHPAIMAVRAHRPRITLI